MAIETPVEVLRRLREESSKRRLARAEAPAQAFSQARSGKEKAGAFGQQIGTAIAQAFRGEPDLEQSPQVIQARKRSKLLNIDPTDVNALKKGIKIASEGEDYEVANRLITIMRQQQALDLQKLNINTKKDIADSKPKKVYKYERYDTDFRKQTMAQLDTDSDISNLEDVHMEVAKPAIVLASEGIYNKNREGGGKMTRPQATALALKHSKAFIIDDFGFNSFNQEGFRESMSKLTGSRSSVRTTINTQQEYDALPSGSTYVDSSDGKTYKKP